MNEISYSCLAFVSLATILVWILCKHRLSSSTERFFGALCIGGLFFYSGIGSAYDSVSWNYTIYYCIFLVVFAGCFLWGVGVAKRVSRRRRAAYERIDNLAQGELFTSVVIGAYIAISLLPLIYPHFRLQLLLNPPMPDLQTTFNNGINVDMPIAQRLAVYAGSLAWPFYLLALYALRRRYLSLALSIALPAYCRYCYISYLGRYEILFCIAMFGGLVWLDRPAIRWRLCVAGIIFVPFLLLFFETYTRIRLGNTSTSSKGAAERIEELAFGETSFPLSWDKIVTSERHANLISYAEWIITLPIPKVLVGTVNGSRINVEISEIVSRTSVGWSGFSVILTGAVVESVYIYGKLFFWLHAVTVGTLAGLFCGFASGSRKFLAILVSLALTFGYIFMRGGIAGSLPQILNSYLSLLGLMTAFLISARGSSSRAPSLAYKVRMPERG
jgi:hypothetical protein